MSDLVPVDPVNREANRNARFLLRSTATIVFLAPFLSLVALIACWPKSSSWEAPSSGPLSWITADIRLMMIVLAAGALGATMHMAVAFSGHRGRGSYDDSWNDWYLLRIPVGMGLALILYFVLRGGLFASGGPSTAGVPGNVNPYGFAGVAGLTGMFARQASDKLREIFDNIFRVAQEKNASKRRPTPSILYPPEPVKVGVTGEALRVTLVGADFQRSSIALVDQQRRATTYLGPEALVMTLDPSDVRAPRTLAISIRTDDIESEPTDLLVSA